MSTNINETADSCLIVGIFWNEFDVALTLVTRCSLVSKITITYKGVNFADAAAVTTGWTWTFVYIFSKKGRENTIFKLIFTWKNPSTFDELVQWITLNFT